MAYLVIDLELSGPDVGFHDILQIGAVLCNSQWQEQSTFLQNVYPENPDFFSTYAEQVHGLSIYDLQDAPALYQVLEDFEQWVRRSLQRAPGASLQDVVLCGQGILTDVNFLKWSFEEENMPWTFSYKVLDLLSCTKLMYAILRKNGYQTPKSQGLDAVAALFGLERSSSQHNALEDARLTAACFRAYWQLIEHIQLPSGLNLAAYAD